jgi:NitT/TauT family transport system substrate-binding protein
VRSKLLKHGGNELFDSSRIPGEIIDVVVVSPDYARRFPQVVEALRDGWFRALEHMKQHPTESAAIMAPREGLSTEEFLAAIGLLKIPSREENAALLAGDKPALPATAEKLQRVLLERRLQEHPVELDTLLGYYRALQTD